MKKINRQDWKYLSILLSSLFVLMIGFQNCKGNNSRDDLSSSSNQSTSLSTTTTSGTLDILDEDPRTSTDMNMTGIRASVVGRPFQTEFFELDQVKMELIVSQDQEEEFLNYDYFYWSIATRPMHNLVNPRRGSPQTPITLVDNEKTEVKSYEYDFENQEMGLYDVVVVPEDSTGQKSAAINKTLVVKQCQFVAPPLEILLLQSDRGKSKESLIPQYGQTSTFIASSNKTEPEIKKILWDVIKDGQKIKSDLLEVDADGELTVTWDNISGEVEVHAFVEYEDLDCIAYRNKKVTVYEVNAPLKPYLNYFRPADTRDPKNVQLAHQYVYKFKRKTGELLNNDLTLEIDWSHKDRCRYKHPIADNNQYRECSHIVNDTNLITALKSEPADDHCVAANPDHHQRSNPYGCTKCNRSGCRTYTEADQQTCVNDVYIDIEATKHHKDEEQADRWIKHPVFRYCPNAKSDDCYFGLNFVEQSDAPVKHDYKCLEVKYLNPSDLVAGSSKTFRWGCSRSQCIYRYVVNQQHPKDFNFATEQFKSIKGLTKKANRDDYEQEYWLHIQAQDQKTGEISPIRSVKFILTHPSSSPPTTTTTTTTTTSATTVTTTTTTTNFN